MSEFEVPLSSDHFMISFNIDCHYLKNKSQNSLFVFDYANADYEGLCDFLMDFDFSCCLLSNEIEHVWFILKDVILTSINLFVPRVKIKYRNQPKWFNSEIRHTMKCIHSHRKRYSLHPTVHNLQKLKSLEEKLDTLNFIS